MQITVTADQIREFRTFADPLLIPVAWWAMKRGLAKSRDLLHEIITDNTNRVRDELIGHIDERIAEHFAGLRSALKLPAAAPPA